eukprot:COSAG06_NODE_10258_length_1716_cov_2.036487_1_plen_291_part_00
MSLGAVLDAGTDDTLLAIAVALPTPADLLRLALTCRAAAQRFYFTATSCSSGGSAVPSGVASSGGTAATAAQQQAETWSIIQEAARQWIANCTDQEQGWVPRRGRESWLGLMWAVRRGAVFGRSHAEITLSEDGSLAAGGATSNTWMTAASKAVMRAGRHYAQFTVVSGMYAMFGVIRPGWNVDRGKNKQWHESFVGCEGVHCFYDTSNGDRYSWQEEEVNVMQTEMENGDRIGLLLDLDQGSMTVYKNDERFGGMATGLSGEYCWAVVLYSGSSARIEAAEPPAAHVLQ